MPRVIAAAPTVLVTEWIDGTPMSRVIGSGFAGQAQPQQVAVGHAAFLGAGRHAHADPHPGNFRLLPDGRLGVLDFGAVARLPAVIPSRSAGSRAWPSRDGPRRCSPVCATRVRQAGHQGRRRRRVLEFLRPCLEPVTRAGVPVHPVLAARGEAARWLARAAPRSSSGKPQPSRRRTCSSTASRSAQSASCVSSRPAPRTEPSSNGGCQGLPPPPPPPLRRSRAYSRGLISDHASKPRSLAEFCLSQQVAEFDGLAVPDCHRDATGRSSGWGASGSWRSGSRRIRAVTGLRR